MIIYTTLYSSHRFNPRHKSVLSHLFLLIQPVLVNLSNCQNLFCVLRFTDPQYWLQYFPPLTQEDLRALGVRVSVGCGHLHHVVCIHCMWWFKVHTVCDVWGVIYIHMYMYVYSVLSR